MFLWFTLVFIAVMALWLWAARRRPGALSSQELQRLQRRWIIGGGMALPAVSIAVILFFGIPAGHRMLMLPQPGETPLRIDVTGRQWQWDVHYPGSGITLIDELHIPAGKRVALHLQTADVIHSFWVPRLGGKLDAIPGRINILHLQADEPGLYHGQCAEYCGIGHVLMKVTVRVHRPEDFARWQKEAPRE